MKTKTHRLRLTRESLRRLTPDDLSLIPGGDGIPSGHLSRGGCVPTSTIIVVASASCVDHSCSVCLPR